MSVLPPLGPPGRDPVSEQYEHGRELLGVDPGLDAIDLVQLDDQTMELNMGPQHPSTHGVLRLVLDLDGEIVRGCRPDIGFLHTGFEKDFERHNYQQCIPYTDRMDYLSPLSNNLGFSLAAERLLGIEVPPRGAVPAGHHVRAGPDRQPPDLVRDQRPRPRRHHPLRLRLAGAGEDPRHQRAGERGADAHLVHPGGRAARRRARRVLRHGRRGGQDLPPPHRRVRDPDHRQPHLPASAPAGWG